jgi:hypothetical protein
MGRGDTLREIIAHLSPAPVERSKLNVSLGPPWGASGGMAGALPFLELYGYVLQRGLPQLLLALDK